MAVANYFHAQHKPVYYNDDDDVACYCDYDDYDDFVINASRGGGGMKKDNGGKHKGKRKNDGLQQQNVYSSKHVRAKDSLRARRKGIKGKALTTNRRRVAKERNANADYRS